MNIKTLGVVIITISVIGFGIGILSSLQKNNNTSILGTESTPVTFIADSESIKLTEAPSNTPFIFPSNPPSVKPIEAPSATPFIYLSPTSVLPATLKFGEKASLKNGRYLTIYQPISDFKPEGNSPNPEYGKKYIIVEGIYENRGDQKVACDPYFSIKLIDNKGNTYDTHGFRAKLPALDCTPDMPDPAYIQPSNSLRGFITFSINKDSEVAKIKYKSFQYNEEVYFSN